MPNRPAGAVKRVPHKPKTLGSKSRIPWPVCARCGLMYLRNDATKRAIRQGCWLYADEKE
jgi:hypothetical protein